MAKQVKVLVGTEKGAFIYHSDENRREWQLTGPHLPGWDVYSLLGDEHGRSRIYAGTSHFVYGPTVRYSDDLGETWTEVESSPQYAKESGFAMKRIWQLVPGHPSEPDTLYAGVEEAGIYVSRDRGETWQELSGLTSHPTRPGWCPGNGGMCLHSIVVDPHDKNRIWVAISAVGVFRSDDGGESWKLCNSGLPPVATGDPYPEIGRCVHKIVLDPHQPDTLYMQFHGGVFKSTDAADSWQPTEEGLPGNFGFPMVISSKGDLYVMPLESDMHRVMKDGHLRVYKSENQGGNWEAKNCGFPPGPHYVGVLRDAMAVDSLESAGIYFGTTMGEVFCSPDDGENWNILPGHFSRINAVKTWVMEA